MLELQLREWIIKYKTSCYTVLYYLCKIDHEHDFRSNRVNSLSGSSREFQFGLECRLQFTFYNISS